jgi:aspartokinase-like uncharacterized kinase
LLISDDAEHFSAIAEMSQISNQYAIIRRLAYWLLISEDAEHFSAIAEMSQISNQYAIIRRLAYWLLISDDDVQWNALMGSASAVADTDKNASRTPFHQAKAALLRCSGA